MIAAAHTEPAVPKFALTLEETAQSLSVCQRTVTRLIARGELTALKIGNRGLRIPTDEIRAWIARQKAK
jgi:excisionase family DNA binding protein